MNKFTWASVADRIIGAGTMHASIRGEGAYVEAEIFRNLKAIPKPLEQMYRGQPTVAKWGSLGLVLDDDNKIQHVYAPDPEALAEGWDEASLARLEGYAKAFKEKFSAVLAVSRIVVGKYSDVVMWRDLIDGEREYGMRVQDFNTMLADKETQWEGALMVDGAWRKKILNGKVRIVSVRP